MKEKIEKLKLESRKNHTLHHEIIDKKFREHGLGFGQPPIIRYLSDHIDATQAEIAEHLHISQPAVAKSLKKMEETGLIVKIENKKDTRCRRVKLTRKGQELFKFAEDTFMRVDYETYKGFTDEELELLISFLQRMNDNLTAYTKEEKDV